VNPRLQEGGIRVNLLFNWRPCALGARRGFCVSTHSQLLGLYQRIAHERDPHKLAAMANQLYDLLRRLERDNFDAELVA
jgi:hypothetical protein